MATKDLSTCCRLEFCNRQILIIHQPGRVFYKEGSVLETTKTRLSNHTHKRDLFLFNDICIITKNNGKVGSTNDVEISLGAFQMERKDRPGGGSGEGERRQAEHLRNDWKRWNRFQVSNKNHDRKICMVELAKCFSKFTRVGDIRDVMEQKNRQRVFCVNLEELIKRENYPSGIPLIVDKLITHLR